MKEFDLGAATIPAPPVAPNGTHGASKKKRSAEKRSARSARRDAVQPASQTVDAVFAAIEITPADAKTWQLHPVLWFQPERAPSAPDWTGLAIERHNRIPRPDFLPMELEALNRPGSPDMSCDAFTPGPYCCLPQSDLVPLGWDPRTLCRKENR